MKLYKTLIALAAGAAAALTTLTAGATEFRSADIHPDDYPTVTAVKFMSERLKALSGGKHSIKVFNNSSLGSEKDTIEQTKIGALQMVRVNIAPMNNICAETQVPTMPFLFRSVDHLHKVLDGPVGEEILKSCEKQGFVGLAYYDSGARSMFTAKKPVRSFADMKGLKVRVQQSDLFVAMVEALGANPTPMPYGEVYTALKTGIVDAAENNWPSYESSRHFEAAKFYNLSEHSLAPEVLVFSKKVWDTLPGQDQALLRQAAKDSVPFMRKLWDEREVKSRGVVEKAGIQVVQLANKKEFLDAMAPVYAKFAATPRLKDLVKRIQETK